MASKKAPLVWGAFAANVADWQKLIEAFVLRIAAVVAISQKLVLLLKCPLGFLWTHVKDVVQILL